MINHQPQVNWEQLQRRVDSCRAMNDAGKEEAAYKMLLDMAKEIMEEK